MAAVGALLHAVSIVRRRRGGARRGPVRRPHRLGIAARTRPASAAKGRRRRRCSSTSSKPSRGIGSATTRASKRCRAIRCSTMAWREWILTVRRQVGARRLRRVALRPQRVLREATQGARTRRDDAAQQPILFGEKEGRIALAHRRKDPLLLFAALQRHLNYPTVPRPGAAR